MSVPTKRQRDLVAKMKWPPCPIETADPVPPIVPDGVSISGGYVPTGLSKSPLPFAEQHFDDRVTLSPERHAELVRKINLAIEALERLVGSGASYDLLERGGAKHCVHCGREYLSQDVDGNLCPSEDCPGFMCRAALKELKK